MYHMWASLHKRLSKGIIPSNKKGGGMMTEVEFYLKEVATWGVEYIETLLDAGYSIVPSDKSSGGWGWKAPRVNVAYTNSDANSDLTPA